MKLFRTLWCPTFLFALGAVGHAQCEIDKLTVGDAQNFDVFGWSVDLSGDLAAVGSILRDEACPNDPACNSGACYIYERQTLRWTQVAHLTASDRTLGDQFGEDVSISGMRVLVGAHQNGAGAAYVFLKTGNGWVEEKKLTGSDSQNNFHFGHSVGLDGDTALIGTMQDNHAGNQSGSAFIFERVAAGWVESIKLTASDAAAGDRYGRSSALRGDVAIIGADRHAEVGVDSGAAYVYERDDNGTPADPLDDAWPEITKLVPSDAAAGAIFGLGVGVDQGTAVVGAPSAMVGGADTGALYVFERMPAGWVEVQKLEASDGEAGDRFGASVSISGARLIVGARGDDDGGSNAGAAYLFEKISGTWVEVSKIVSSGAAANDHLGEEGTVAISGDEVIVASPLEDSGLLSNSGAAYLYDLSAPLGQNYCGPAVANSSGVPAEIHACGSDLVADGDLLLRATHMPMNKPGYFLVSQTQGFIPNPAGSQGNLCLKGQIGRYAKAVKSTGPTGAFSLYVDIADIPPQHTAVQVGETWNFQAWFRDKNPATTSNFTDGVAILFQ